MTEAVRQIVRQKAMDAAPLLIGCILDLNGKAGRIVEVEAYTQDDSASHSFKGQTSRNRSMFLEGGHWYVYQIYGVHRCLNLVTGDSGTGEAVLIRALEPLDTKIDRYAYAGPGLICRELGIDLSFDGEPVGKRISLMAGTTPLRIETTARIGITKSAELIRRFVDPESDCLSRKPPRK